jgi:hypothetical protein
MAVLEQLDDVADNVLRKAKKIVRPLARTLLLSTFIEDGFRMFYQWEDQVAYLDTAWKSGKWLAYLFVLTNLFGQLIPSAIILTKADVSPNWVRIAVFILFGILTLQTLAYKVLWDRHFFMRNIAVAGSLLLVYAETKTTKTSIFAGEPTLGSNNSGD